MIALVAYGLRRGLQLGSTLLGFQSSLFTYTNAFDEAVAVARAAIEVGERSGGVESRSRRW